MLLLLLICLYHFFLKLAAAAIDPIRCGNAPLNKNFSRYDYLVCLWHLRMFATLQQPSLFLQMPDTHRLVGGLETKPHTWPWTGQLVTVKEVDEAGNATVVHKCGCALIDHEFVGTAAHCFAKRQSPSTITLRSCYPFSFSRIPRRYRVMLGGHEIYSGQAHRVLSISIHPLYQIVHSAYDVALLRYNKKSQQYLFRRRIYKRISPEVEYGAEIWPICLPTLPVKINGKLLYEQQFISNSIRVCAS